jgi:hypothetical protein
MAMGDRLVKICTHRTNVNDDGIGSGRRESFS